MSELIISSEFLTLGFFISALLLLFMWLRESGKRRRGCRSPHSLYLFQCKNCHLIFVGENDAKAPTAAGRSASAEALNSEETESSPLSRCPNCRTWCVRQWIEAGRR